MMLMVKIVGNAEQCSITAVQTVSAVSPQCYSLRGLRLESNPVKRDG